MPYPPYNANKILVSKVVNICFGCGDFVLFDLGFLGGVGEEAAKHLTCILINLKKMKKIRQVIISFKFE